MAGISWQLWCLQLHLNFTKKFLQNIHLLIKSKESHQQKILAFYLSPDYGIKGLSKYTRNCKLRRYKLKQDFICFLNEGQKACIHVLLYGDPTCHRKTCHIQESLVLFWVKDWVLMNTNNILNLTTKLTPRSNWTLAEL